MSPSPVGHEPIAPAILDEAADWLMRLQAGPMSNQERDALECWRRRSPAHGRAWHHAQALLATLGTLPPELAQPVLGRSRRQARRATLARLLLLASAVPVGTAAWQLSRGWGSDIGHRTATGEWREIILADGTAVMLNTGSAIDVHFDDNQRLIRLRAGEIQVRTAPDPRRKLRVGTDEGNLLALGTTFTVRQDTGLTRVAVAEGAVRLEPADMPAALWPELRAAEQASFDTRTVYGIAPAGGEAFAWTHGMLLADHMRLADFLAELSRYRRGILRSDPALDELRVSGSFPVRDTDRTLRMLESTYPVRVRTRAAGYWTTLEPRRDGGS